MMLGKVLVLLTIGMALLILIMALILAFLSLRPNEAYAAKPLARPIVAAYLENANKRLVYCEDRFPIAPAVDISFRYCRFVAYNQLFFDAHMQAPARPEGDRAAQHGLKDPFTLLGAAVKNSPLLVGLITPRISMVV